MSPTANPTIDTTKITSWRPNQSRIEVTVTLANGEKAVLFFPLDVLLGLVEACSAATVAICKQATGTVPYLSTEAVQVSMAGATIGIEVAFGSRGHLHFELPRDQAQKLRDQISAGLDQTPPTPSPQLQH